MSERLSLLEQTMVLAGIVGKIERDPARAARVPHILFILREHLAYLEARLAHPAGSARGTVR